MPCMILQRNSHQLPSKKTQDTTFSSKQHTSSIWKRVADKLAALQAAWQEAFC